MRFKEDPESFKHADVFPSFSGLRPLILGSEKTTAAADAAKSLRVGVVIAGELSCLPSYPTNVIAGLHECLVALNPGSKLIGFIGGPEGLLQGKCRELNAKEIKASLNLGSWKLLSHGSCRDGSYETPGMNEFAHETCFYFEKQVSHLEYGVRCPFFSQRLPKPEKLENIFKKHNVMPNGLLVCRGFRVTF